AEEQAREYGHSVQRELCYLAVHGICHLLGYDHIDDADRAVMREKEEKVLNRLGIVR
ncbi:MAG: rRNA maturation RNase YbeY, partial [Clostridia bacterium]|nr:rRNA maturation RNase YbeY [Clostridia bacterium]